MYIKIKCDITNRYSTVYRCGKVTCGKLKMIVSCNAAYFSSLYNFCNPPLQRSWYNLSVVFEKHKYFIFVGYRLYVILV